ncbi:MAG: hypothetical protein A3I73_05265 [Omnitrophica bacterium RIFCSPLOWO2_02_FULL_45_16]|nr:MAG: hypothetical protein A3I73_05265 [Omnitrophica bacterium RIFCSPLOWO2_02_FULL_45_16]
MSIIQEALKKAQVDYIEKKKPLGEESPRHGMAAPKVDIRGKIRPARKTKSSITILSIFVVSILIVSALGLRIFLIYKGNLKKEKNIAAPLLSKEIPAAPLAEIAAPESFVKSKIEPASPAPPPIFILNGIMYLDATPQAIINGYILEEGDVINGATVMVIDKDYVLLNLKDDKLKLNLKQ